MKSLTFAIDPGLTGAVAVLIDGLVAYCYDMPVKIRSSRRVRNKHGNMETRHKYEVDAWMLGRLMQPYVADARLDNIKPHVVIEQVASRPDQGVASTFNFGDAFGVARAVSAYLVGNDYVHRVVPTVWKKHFGLLKQDKDAARIKAIEQTLLKDLLKRKKDIGRADAILIGLWFGDTQAGVE